MKTTTSNDWTKAQVEAIENAVEIKGENLNNDDVKNLVTGNALFTNIKSVPMLRSKVVNLGYYQKAAPKSVGSTGTPTVRKMDYVEALQTLSGVDDLKTLEKASKPQLEALANALTLLSAQDNAKNGLTE